MNQFSFAGHEFFVDERITDDQPDYAWWGCTAFRGDRRGSLERENGGS